MPQIDIADQLTDRFAAPLPAGAERRIIFWHDPDGQFEEQFSSWCAAQDERKAEDPDVSGPVPNPARRLRLLAAEDGGLFSAKRLLAREDITSDFLVYRRRTRGALEGDLLADIDQYAEHFQADYLSLLSGQLDAADTDEVRQALERGKTFFRAKARVARFSELVARPQSADDVRRGILGTLLLARGERDATREAIVRAYLRQLWDAQEDVDPTDPGSFLEQFDALIALDKYDQREALEALLQHACGYRGDLADVESLTTHVLLSASSCTLPQGLLAGLEGRYSEAHGPFCLGLMRDGLAAGEVERDAWLTACRRCEDALNLSLRFDAATPQDLMDCDVFPAINEALLKDLLFALAQGADRADEALRTVQLRKNMEWYDLLSHHFELLVACAEAQSFERAHAHGFEVGSARAVWEAYIGTWYQMDSLYRRGVEAYRSCQTVHSDSLEDASRAAVDWLERAYRWFLDEANSVWLRETENDLAQQGRVEGIARSDRFYDETLIAEIGLERSAVVIISDALRYEVGAQLASQLERELRGAAELRAMQAPFPSVTEFGMAALLPHVSIEYDGARQLVLADGLLTSKTQEREKVLVSRHAASRALRADDYLALSREDRRDLLRANNVVYLYHNKIDAMGEQSATEQDVFSACRTTIDDLVRLVGRVMADRPGAQVLISADHGFLYTREPLREVDLLSASDLREDGVLLGKRYAILTTPPQDDTLVRVNLSSIGHGISYTGAAPRQTIRFRLPGGTRNYVHGGLSLQELCVPLIRFRPQRGGKAADERRAAALSLLSTDRRVTSMMFRVELYQREAVGGSIRAGSYELVMVDRQGTEVSDVRRAEADLTDPSDSARVSSVQLNLRAGRAYNAREPYYLVCRDRESGAQAWREEYRLDIAFAPLDDFGF